MKKCISNQFVYKSFAQAWMVILLCWDKYKKRAPKEQRERDSEKPLGQVPADIDKWFEIDKLSSK